MGARDSRVRDASRQGVRILGEFGEEVRAARLAAGVSQGTLARSSGVSRSTVSRIERGGSRALSVVAAARVSAAAGLRLSLRVYPAGPPIRDIAHLQLIERFRSRVSPAFRWFAEAPVAARDGRAIDVLLVGAGLRIGVEAETRVRDFQALVREIELKRRDGNLDRCILLVLRSRANASALRFAGDGLIHAFPANTRTVLRALSRGSDPGADGIVLL